MRRTGIEPATLGLKALLFAANHMTEGWQSQPEVIVGEVGHIPIIAIVRARN